MDSNQEYTFFKKVVIIGSEGSGKSSLISIFETKSFQEESPSNYRT
jgi:ABC-type molybdenum transport system ATPase subunit/photorepair protein PhrA